MQNKLYVGDKLAETNTGLSSVSSESVIDTAHALLKQHS